MFPRDKGDYQVETRWFEWAIAAQIDNLKVQTDRLSLEHAPIIGPFIDVDTYD